MAVAEAPIKETSMAVVTRDLANGKTFLDWDMRLETTLSIYGCLKSLIIRATSKQFQMIILIIKIC